MAFPPAFLDELRSRVGLVQVVSRRVKLQKAGREWKGCCPFHNEKTPSFYVNEEKQFYHCLAAETLVMTKDGRVPIAELTGKSVEVLTRGSAWVPATFGNYGRQRLWRIDLSRNGVRKSIFATDGHRWFVRGRETHVLTRDLRAGHRLEAVLPERFDDWQLDPAGVRHGIVFGDGTLTKGVYGLVNLHGAKDAVLAGWFPEQSPALRARPNGDTYLQIYGGRAFTHMKGLPALDSDRNYILGFLAGYLAADGHVARDGTVMLNSASREVLEAVRNLATRVGIATYGVTEAQRFGFGREMSALYRVHFVPSTLQSSLFLLPQAKERFETSDKQFDRVRWTVLSVEPSDRVEDVYCASVPGTHAFALDDNILTGNCFGCGAHGDVIRFVVEQEGLRFPDAVRSLAAEAGLEVPEESPEAREREREKAGLHDVMAEAARWFAAQLNGLSGANARRYVGERALTAETVERFGLGFAPDGNKLKSTLKSHGEDKLLECGLIGRAEDRDETYDRFRGRLMFPIRDPRGRVVGFGGRILGDGQPKYLNSPDTALFDKGRLLYNLDQAGPVARKSARLFVVEGYLDVIALSQAGIAEAVAPLGTALTEQQLQLLWRIVPEPILCFDGDKAGLAAAGRAARRALPLLRPGCSLRILTLPQGQDPDDIIRQHGPEHFLKLAEAAEPLHAFLWRSVLESTDASTPERRAGLRQELRELANMIADTEIKALYQNQFRESFNAQFEWRPTARQPYVAAAPQPAQPKMRRPTQAKYAMLEVICGWLLYPEIVAADLEQAASLPLYRDLRRLIPLRQAILDAVAWDPTIGPADLRHTLVQRGHTEVVDSLWGALRLHLPFTFEALEPERAKPMLAKVSWGLIELVENQEAIVAETAALKASDGDEAEEHARRQRELVLRRDEIYRELADFALETGAFAANKVRLQVDNDTTPPAPSEASPAQDDSLPARHIAAG